MDQTRTISLSRSTLIAGALIIVILTGTGGYYLGSRNTAFPGQEVTLGGGGNNSTGSGEKQPVSPGVKKTRGLSQVTYPISIPISAKPSVIDTVLPTLQMRIEEDGNRKIYTFSHFQITLPTEYAYENNQSHSFYDPTLFYSAVFQTNDPYTKLIRITWTNTTATDPCTLIPNGNTNAFCTTISGYRALDWGGDKGPQPMGPTSLGCVFVQSGIKTEINFLKVERPEMNQILSTIKFTQ
jgi:hypothetical protein